MRILAITDSYPPHHSGGYEIRCKELLDGFIKNGHAVTIITTLCPEKNCKLHNGEANIYRILRHQSKLRFIIRRIFYDFIELKKIVDITQKFNPHLIYLSHMGDLSKAIISFFMSSQYPVVYDDGGAGLAPITKVVNHGVYFYRRKDEPFVKKNLKNIIECFLKKISGGLIQPHTNWPRNFYALFNNRFSLEIAQKNGMQARDAKVIYSGINLQKFYFSPRDELRLPLRIVVPGRISPEKGTKDALALLHRLFENNIEAQITIVGEIYSENYFKDIEKRIDELDIGEKVKILEKVGHTEMVKFYSNSDICFFPSYQKYGLSRVPLEAMACGCLLITYGNESSRDIVENFVTGFIVQEGEIETVVKLIKKMLENKNQYREIILTARKFIEKYHSMDSYIESVERYFLSIVSAYDSER